MDFDKILFRLNQREILLIDVIQEILNKTQREPDLIKMYIDEIDVYIKTYIDEVSELMFSNGHEYHFDKSEVMPIIELRDFLKNRIEQNQETPPPPSKKQAKNIWGLVARYEFLKEFEIENRIKGLSQSDKALVISQILGCNIDNAKKIINGKYPTNETHDEQLERNQLISKIK
jgi:hypothetical protein